MANKYAKLDACLLEACRDLKALFAKHDLPPFRLYVECYDDNELSVKYIVKSEFDRNSPQGNDLDEVIKEYVRRQGWDVANNAKRISGY